MKWNEHSDEITESLPNFLDPLVLISYCSLILYPTAAKRNQLQSVRNVPVFLVKLLPRKGTAREKSVLHERKYQTEMCLKWVFTVGLGGVQFMIPINLPTMFCGTQYCCYMTKNIQEAVHIKHLPAWVGMFCPRFIQSLKMYAKCSIHSLKTMALDVYKVSKVWFIFFICLFNWKTKQNTNIKSRILN